MKNPFHKKTHELNERERLEQKARKAMNLEAQVDTLKRAIDREKAYSQGLQENLGRLYTKANAYDWLREQELMLMTSDGVKYLKGEDLDAYTKEQTTDMLDLQESVLERLTKQFNEALRRGMNPNPHILDSFRYTTKGS